MAAIDQVDVTALQVAGDETVVRALVGSMFWKWYHEHQDQKVTTIRVWFISKTVYVRDLQAIFVLLFGPES
jgi:hypothetical protein